jgi:NitT/TauT family transport system substrate-binding protein
MRIGAISRAGAAVAVAAAMGTLAGCSADGTAQASTDALEQRTIVVDSVPAAEEAGFYVAQAQGLFAQQGLKVTIKTVTGGEKAIPDLQSGTAQLVAGNYVSFILAQMNGQFNGKPANMRIIAAGSEIEPGTEALYVKPNSKFKTVGDLAKAHARVGLNTPNNIGDVLMGALLAQYNYTTGVIKRVYPVQGFNGVMKDLKLGLIDAGWLPQPLADEAEQRFGAVPIADFDQGSLQDFPFTGYIGTTHWVQSHPNTVAAFLRALAQGQQLADTNRPDVEAAMRQFVQDVKPIVSDTMAIDSYPLAMDVPELCRVSNSMLQFGVIKHPYDIKNMIQPEPGLIEGPCPQ